MLKESPVAVGADGRAFIVDVEDEGGGAEVDVDCGVAAVPTAHEADVVDRVQASDGGPGGLASVVDGEMDGGPAVDGVEWAVPAVAVDEAAGANDRHVVAFGLTTRRRARLRAEVAAEKTNAV